MGADIHLYAEQKLTDGTWAMCNQFVGISAEAFQQEGPVKGRMFYRAKSRNYSFFAALAGVRGVGPEPRGLPEDVSPFVADEAKGWDSDGHSHSWYTLEEFAPIFMEHWMTESEIADVTSRRMNNGWSLAAQIAERFLGIDLPYTDGEEDPSRIRLVFWFDN